MTEMQNLFGNLGNTLNNMPLSGSLGLLTTGVGLLEGQPIGQAVQAGLGTYQGLAGIEEDRKRKEMIQKLISEGGFTKQEQALISASNNPAGTAVQIRNQKQARSDAAANRATMTTLTPDQVSALGLAKGTIVQRNNKTGGLDIVSKATSADTGPESNLGKLAADYKAGLISVDAFNAGVKKLTFIAPPKDPGAASTVGKIQQDFENGLIDETTRNAAIKKATQSRKGESFTVSTPDGTTFTYGPGQGANQKITEQQGKDLGFAARLPIELLDELDKVDTELTNYGDVLLDQDPTGILRGPLQDPNYQIARTLAQEFLTPLIRKDTGAAIQAWETSLYDAMYFPKPGDSQQVIERKRKARRIARDGLLKNLPPLLRVQVDEEFAKQFRQLQQDVLPKGSELLKINEDWAKATQTAPLPEQATSQQSQSTTQTSTADVATMPYSELVNVDTSKLSMDEIDIMLKRFEEGR